MDTTPSSIEPTVSATPRHGRIADEDPPVPPDSGWAWVVLAGFFVAQFIVIGFYGAAAVYVPVWMAFFDSSAVETSLVLSFSSFFFGFSSVVSGILITRFSVRAVWIAGGVVSSVGLMFSTLATSTLYLMFSIGLVTAQGFSMCINCGFVALGQYFKKRLSLAIGIAAAGFGAGQLALTPLFNYLIDEYGWKGSVLIIAGINLHLVATGALARPLSPRTRRRNMKKHANSKREVTSSDAKVSEQLPQEEPETRNECHDEELRSSTKDEVSDAICTVTVTATASPLHDSAIAFHWNDKEDLLSRDNNDDCDDGNAGEMSSRAETLSDAADISEGPACVQKASADRVGLVHDLSPNDNAGRRSSSTDLEPVSPDERHNRSLANHTNSRLRFGNRWKVYMSRLRTFMLEKYGLSGLFHNASFILLIPTGIALGVGWGSVVFHLDARAESVGLQPAQGATLLAIMGGGNLASSLSHGWFVDKGYISPQLALILGSLCNAVATFIFSLLVAFVPMAAVSLIFGMATGVSEPVFFVLLQGIVRPTEVAGATSIGLVCWGIGEIVGASLSGWIYDTFESYNSSYYMAGSAFVVAAIVTSVIYSLEKRKRMSKEKLVNETVDVNNEVHVTAHNKAIQENGVANPIYNSGGESDVSEQDPSSESGLRRHEQKSFEGQQRLDSESFC